VLLTALRMLLGNRRARNLVTRVLKVGWSTDKYRENQLKITD